MSEEEISQTVTEATYHYGLERMGFSDGAERDSDAQR